MALHVSKLPLVLPFVVDEFGLTLSQSGNLVAVFALLTMFTGCLLGLFVGRFGYVRFAFISVGLGAVGSIGGSVTDSVTLLLTYRIIEGLGWTMGVIAFPTILSALSATRDRPVVMGLWGAFMPIGGGFILFVGPTLQNIGGWRLVWHFTSALAVLGLFVVAWFCYQNRDLLNALKQPGSRAVLSDLLKPASLAIAICFMCYSFQIHVVNSFLPTLLMERSGLNVAYAGYFAALVLLCNSIGNMSSGWLIKHGFKQSSILTIAAATMGLFGFISISVDIAAIRIVSAMIMTGAGGLIPGTLFSTAPAISSSTASVGMLIGFMMQFSGAGQLFGPITLTRVVEATNSWFYGAMLCIGAGIIGSLAARPLRHIQGVKAT